MTNIDLYSTHLSYLSEIFKYTGKLKNVVEFGMGNFSTDLLINNCENVISIEMQSEYWYQNIYDKFHKMGNWSPYKLLGPLNFQEIQYPEIIDLSFVDGHGDSRPDCINFMMNKKCPIIVAHDTESSSYNWHLVNNISYKKIEFKQFENWTTLWTIDYNLYNFMINIK